MPDRRRPWFRPAIFIAVVAGGSLVAWQQGWFAERDAGELAALIRQARAIPAIGPLFVLAYAVTTTFGIPATLLTLAGGAIFGVVLGSALNWLGAMVGATGAYFLARALGRDALTSIVGRRASRLDELVSDHGFLTLLRLRLIPVVPFNALNFGAGIAGMKLRDYLLATGIGILPGTIVYTYFADALLSGVSGAGRRALINVAVAGALLIALSFLPTIARKWSERRHTAGATRVERNAAS
ncbi:MAG: TVP38/TMEM64 family protein [Gemmatimonadaceae bacterium]